jgi:hypothetical protein
VTWPALIQRFIQFVTDNYQVPEKLPTIVLVIEVFQIHLEKARTLEDGTLFDPSMPADSAQRQKLASFHARQTLLEENGICRLIFLIMSFHKPERPGESSSAQSVRLADAVLALLQELLLGGNKDVQRGFYDLLANSHPDDNRFLESLRQRAVDGLSELRRSQLESELLRENSFAEPFIDSATAALAAQKLLVESHMEELQKFMIKQQNKNTNIDLVSLSATMLLQICSEERKLHYLASSTELTSAGRLVESILEFLVSSIRNFV